MKTISCSVYMRLALWLAILAIVHPLWSQDLTAGIRPFTSYDVSNLDLVDLSTGRLTVNIPLLKYAQLGRLPNIDIGIVSSPIGDGGAGVGVHVNSGLLTEAGCSFGETYVSCLGMADDTGAIHVFAQEFPAGTPSSSMASSNGYPNQRSVDMTGYNIYTTVVPPGIPINVTVLDKNGIQQTWSPWGGDSVVQDSYGNKISYTYTYLGWPTYAYTPGLTDSLGRNIPLDFLIPREYISMPVPPAGCKTVNYPGFQGANYPIIYCLQNISTSDSTCSVSQSGSANAITSVQLPDGNLWRFTYDAFGNIASISTPRGESIAYTYYPNDCDNLGNGNTVYLRVKSKSIDYNDGTGSHEWDYTYQLGSAGTNILCSRDGTSCSQTPATCSGYAQCGISATTVTSPPLNGQRNDIVHQFWQIISPYWASDRSDDFSVTGPPEGRENGTQYYAGTGTSRTLQKEEKADYAYDINGECPDIPPITSTSCGVLINIRLAAKYTQLNTGEISKTTYTYDAFGEAISYPGGADSIAPGVLPISYGQLLSVSEYDYGTPQPDMLASSESPVAGALLRTTSSRPWTAANPEVYNYLTIPASTTVIDGSGNIFKSTQNQYDIYGNLTSTDQSVDYVAAHDVITQYTYNAAYGMLDSMTDGNGGATTITYDTTGLYPSKIVGPQTGLVNHVNYYSYDTNTGLLQSEVDENGSGPTDTAHITQYSYADPLYRITDKKYPDGGEVKYNYSNISTVEVSSLIDAASNEWTDSISYYDTGGRKISEATLASNMWNHVDICYDAFSEQVFTTYKYQTSDNTLAARSCPGSSTTTLPGDNTSYDALGRTILVSHSDGSTVQSIYSGYVNDLITEGHPGASGSDADVVQAEKVFTADALGRMTSVCEVVSSIPSAGATPSSCAIPTSAPKTGFLTRYSYDALGNLTTVQLTCPLKSLPFEAGVLS
jgi:YD repeat-containing protein